MLENKALKGRDLKMAANAVLTIVAIMEKTGKEPILTRYSDVSVLVFARRQSGFPKEVSITRGIPVKGDNDYAKAVINRRWFGGTYITYFNNQDGLQKNTSGAFERAAKLAFEAYSTG